MLPLLLLLVSSLANSIVALRTKEAWGRLFTIDTSRSFQDHSDDVSKSLSNSQNLYFNNENKHLKHPIVFQFTDNCGIVCHEKISSRINAYSIHSPNQLGKHLIHPSVNAETPKHFYDLI